MRLKLLLLFLPTNINDCHNCRHFIEHPKKYDDLSKCKIFKINNKNNQTIYYNAEECRRDQLKCGIIGKNFIQK
jgi:hypothetical protein